MKITGNAWKFGDNISNDQIFPSRYVPVVSMDPSQAGKYALAGEDPEFASKVQKGDIIVAGVNFGCGSSREHSPLSLRNAGVGAVIAKSFPRIFFRNAINLGLPVFVCKDVDKYVNQGDRLEIDVATSTVMNLTTGQEFDLEGLSDKVREILTDGGLINHTRKMLASKKQS